MTEHKVDRAEWRKRPLYKLLYSKLPWLRSKTQPELLDIHKLAGTIGYSHEAVYKWLRNGKMSPRGAKIVVKISRNTIENRDLYPFLLS